MAGMYMASSLCYAWSQSMSVWVAALRLLLLLLHVYACCCCKALCVAASCMEHGLGTVSSAFKQLQPKWQV